MGRSQSIISGVTPESTMDIDSLSNGQKGTSPASANLLTLPPELMLQCLSFLQPLDLASISRTCRLLQKAASTDSLWQSYINANLPQPVTSPQPLSSFRDLYIAHHAYWFVPRQRVWLSDAEHWGRLVISRYNSNNGNIEAFAVVAERGEHTVSRWSYDQNVLVHGFEPNVRLHLEQPVVKLAIDSPRVEIIPSGNRGPLNSLFSSKPKDVPALSQEVLMECTHYNSPGHQTAFALARDLPADYINPGTAVWPPLSLPAPSRTRNLSASDFSSLSHRPTKHDEISQSTFRVRKWFDFHNRRGSSTISQFNGPDRQAAAQGLSFSNIPLYPPLPIPTSIIERRSEHVNTFGTIDPKAYTPTPRKPWRGIYCGDYSGHGCEFLIVLQPEEGEEGPLPEGLNWLNEWLTGGRLQNNEPGYLGLSTINRMNEILEDMAQRDGFRRRVPAAADDSDTDTDTDESMSDHEDGPVAGGIAEANGTAAADDDEADDWVEPEGVRGDLGRQTSLGADSAVENEDVYSGRLVAIKLTGDPHVPRGEITFIAPDIGDKGLVRTAQEEIFHGARVVRSAGHIANRGFIHDEYIPSQLILVSHDCLAQYWQGFGHISFYKRVDLDALMGQV